MLDKQLSCNSGGTMLYPMVPLQEGFWFAWKLNPQSYAYNTSIQLQLNGNMDVEHFKKSIMQCITLFDSLRVKFISHNGDICAELSSDIIPTLDYFDLTTNNTINDEEKKDQATHIVHNLARQPFDLFTAPLARFCLIKVSHDTYFFGTSIPHILFDGGSAQLFLKTLSMIYNNDPLEFETLKPGDQLQQYVSFYQHPQSNNDTTLSSSLAYWENILKDHNLELSFNKTLDSNQNIQGNCLRFKLTNAQNKKLKSLAKQHKTSLFVTITSLFNILVSNYFNNNDIVSHYSINTRPLNLKHCLGLFVNNVPLRVKLEAGMSFQDIIQQCHQQRKDAKKHAHVPLPQIIKHMRKTQTISNNNMNLSLSEGNVLFPGASLHDMIITPLEFNYQEVINDLALIYDTSMQDTIVFEWQYKTKLFELEQIQELTSSFSYLIDQISQDPLVDLSTLKVISPESEQLIHQFNHHTHSSTTELEPISTTIRKIARQYSSQTALINHTQQQYSYTELLQMCDQISLLLSEHSVKPGSRVMVYMHSSPDLIATMLAIFTLGACYIPIYPGTPQSRLNDILQDSQTNIIITTPQQQAQLSNLQNCPPVVTLDPTNYSHTNIKTIPPTPSNHLELPAYILYTSGTTGKPKGVEISHRSIALKMQWMQKTFPLQVGDRVLHHINITFDPSLHEMLWPLSNGACIAISDPEQSGRPDYLVALIHSQKINCISCVPSLLSMLLNNPSFSQCNDLNYVFSGGGALHPELVNKFYQEFQYPQTTLYNLYGPTETTITATYYPCLPNQNNAHTIPIGKPAEYTSIYILNDYQQLQPLGAVGELYIGGDCLANGYINNPSANKKKFVPNNIANDPSQSRLYRTGDLGYYTKEGNIQFVGRRDNQIKLNGYRIEIDDIEHNILAHPDVGKVAIIKRDHPYTHTPMLIAFYTSNPNSQPTNQDIKRFLTSRVPDYMVPALFVKLDHMPLLRNGKINRHQLADRPIELQTSKTEERPLNKTQESILTIWSHQLGIPSEKIGIHDKFFEIGGDSISLIAVACDIEALFNIKISLSQFFSLPTITDCAHFIDQYTAQNYSRQHNMFLSSDMVKKRKRHLNRKKILSH